MIPGAGPEGSCYWCAKEGARWAQFPFGQCRACDECTESRGGHRFEMKPVKRMVYRHGSGRDIVIEEAP